MTSLQNLSQVRLLYRILHFQITCLIIFALMFIGYHTCCFWVGEGSSNKEKGDQDCIVLFDEDRFVHIKSLRAEGKYLPLLNSTQAPPHKFPHSRLKLKSNYALDPDDFDLVIKVFLRGQSMSSFISSTEKHEMAFW